MTIPIIIVLLFCQMNTDLILFAAEDPGPYGGGDGTAEDPYRIYTAEQMNEIGTRPNDWSKHFLLMADIDLSEFQGETFHIIGFYTDSFNNQSFSGVFDGNNHAIHNFSYTSINQDNVGIFGYVSGAQIKNLGIVDPNIHTGGDAVGSIVGWLRNGTIFNCSAKNCRLSGVVNVGGLVGRAQQGNIKIFHSHPISP